MKKISLAFGCFLISIFCYSANYAPQSVLSSGKWVQLKVSENAVYKLSYEQIREMGFSNPAKIKIYGYGGWILDQDFRNPFIDDLPEVSVYLHKGEDMVFNAGDFLLFYGRGLTKWTFDTVKDLFVHQNNPYSLYASYFITENEDGPKEMSLQASYSGAATQVNVFDDYLVHEKDQIAILHSGRELFGESFFGNPSQNFPLNIPGITNDAGQVWLSFAAAPANKTSITLSINDVNVISSSITYTTSDYRKAELLNTVGAWIGNKTENPIVNIHFDTGSSSIAYLNYFTLNMKRELRFYNKAYTFFRHKNSRSQNLDYVISNFTEGFQVWNISDITNIQNVDLKSLADNKRHFAAASNSKVSEYVMVNINQDFPTPQVVGEIGNQNLHQLPQTDFLIIVPENYFDLAKQLAEKHHQKQNLHVTVVQSDKIYNEFSSGTPDVTAYRRFLKMFYDRATTPESKPKYLLLYGDGNYNNRTIDPKKYLLTYQFENSIDESNSFGTDDYFGFLDDSEGVDLARDVVDVGIGRIPVNTYEAASNTLNKMLRYMDDTYYSAWKNRVIFSADDTGKDAFCTYGEGANTLAKYVENNYPQYMVVKSYMDAMAPATINGKKVYPDAKKKVLNAMNEGAFLFNYSGHGSPTTLSGEDMMNISNIRQMKFPSLPLWITATCDFGRFDDDTNSAGEEVFLNPNSAGIALFTTSRVVYASNNQKINIQLIQNIFSKKADGSRYTLGDIMRNAKIELGMESNKLNYILLGNPAMQLNYPENNVQLEKINGQSVGNDETVIIKALEQVTLTGSITDDKGLLLNNFNGTIQGNIFDGQTTVLSVTVLANTPPNPAKPEQVSDGKGNTLWSFLDFNDLVYKGNGEVKNGRFTLSFTTPLDIAYRSTNGKMNFYAWDNTHKCDAAGNFQSYKLNGMVNDYPLNNIGPEIRAMYLNSKSFQSGNVVNETPEFHAEVFDADGLNYTGSGTGHDISITIDRKTWWTWTHPKEQIFFPSGNPLTADTIAFSIPELPEGRHSLELKVWDILNNSSSKVIDFEVVKGYGNTAYTLNASENPAKESLDFQIKRTVTNPQSNLNVEIRVSDLEGNIVWTHTANATLSTGAVYSIPWNLNNNGGQKLKAGVYLYRAIFQTTNGQEITKEKKLIVL